MAKTHHGAIYDFTSSAIVDHIILYYFLQQDFAKWLGMTCKNSSIWSTKIAIEMKNQKYIVHAQKYFDVTHEFYRFLNRG